MDAEPDRTFEFGSLDEGRWALDEWGVPRLVLRPVEELPLGWRWLDDEPESEPEAA